MQAGLAGLCRVETVFVIFVLAWTVEKMEEHKSLAGLKAVSVIFVLVLHRGDDERADGLS